MIERSMEPRKGHVKGDEDRCGCAGEFLGNAPFLELRNPRDLSYVRPVGLPVI
jgi:hypothetical protein